MAQPFCRILSLKRQPKRSCLSNPSDNERAFKIAQLQIGYRSYSFVSVRTPSGITLNSNRVPVDKTIQFFTTHFDPHTIHMTILVCLAVTYRLALNNHMVWLWVMGHDGE
jgi:hypothetical protein